MRDRTILITGGAAGIGRSAALLCAERGARVAVLDIDQAGLERVTAEARERGASAAAGIRCDVSSEADVIAAYDAVISEFGAPDGVFANAGLDRGGALHELPAALWQRVIDTNLNGIFHTCQQGVRAMLAAGRGGSIVCTSSPAAFVAFAAGGASAYSASKGAVSAFVRCLAIDYARYGIRVNAVVPGATETTLMWANVPPAEIESARRQISAEVPLGRLAHPDEPARAAVWLLSGESSYVTGSHLVCDGGILAKASISL